MTTFVALYRGQTVSSARLVAVSADPRLVHEIAGQLLLHPEPADDPALGQLDAGRRGALHVIRRETHDAKAD